MAQKQKCSRNTTKLRENPERALEYTVTAAKQATDALAFDRAARLLKQALALAGHEHSQRLKLLSDLGEALGNDGRCIASAEVFLEAATAAEPEARTSLRRRAASQYLLGGQIDKGRELIREDLPAARCSGSKDARTHRRVPALAASQDPPSRAWVHSS